ncbi:MAG TPA: hypothetical protein ENJ30_02060 [Desulfobulbaceae bacterium]|nr:hypothetical protein [Desulfobulbaceae bacterium]
MKTVNAATIGRTLGVHVRTVQIRASREKWPFTTGTTRGGAEKRFKVKALPEPVRIALARQRATAGIDMDDDFNAGLKAGKQLAKQKAREQEEDRITRERNLATFNRLTPEKQAIAYGRQDVLRARDGFLATLPKNRTKKKGTAMFCQLYNSGEIRMPERIRRIVPQVSVSTLLRWQRLLESQGPAGLAPGYCNPKKGKTSLTKKQQDFIVGMIKKQPHCSVANMEMAMEARFAKIPHNSTIRRFMGRWKRENAGLLLYCTNPDVWRNKQQFAVGDASEQVERLNQVWEFDSTPADVMLADGRHSLIGVIDVYTRRLKLLVSKTSRSTAVAALIRRALLDWGVPEIAKTDNGADYVSHHIVQVFEGLGVEQKLCPPFTPENKPHIERAFKTFAHSFMEMMPGYIGHNVAQRKDIEARKSFAQRLMKRGGDEVVEINMTAEELQSYCDRWCEAIYHRNQHRKLDGKTPADVARIWSGTEKRIKDERALDILLAEAPKGDGSRVVGKSGVAVDRVNYIAEALPDPGTMVRVKLDPADLGTIFLFDEEGAFLCVAQDPMRTGLDRSETAAKLKNRQKEIIRKGAKALKKLAREQALDDIHEEVLAFREAKIANIIDLPKRSEEYSTTALEEAGKAVAALDQERRERNEIDEIMIDSLVVDKPQPKTESKPAGKNKVVPIFSSEMEWHDWLRNQENNNGLSRANHERLTEFYQTRSGRMCLELYGDLRVKFGLREDVKEN